MKIAILSLLVASLAGLAVAETAAPAVRKSTTPDHRLGEAWWKQRHEQRVAQAKQGGWEVAFIGDSITQAWEGPGKTVWQEFYGTRKAINLGFSGDRTEHVLWRLANGEADGYQPKLAIIMIGTNNTGHRNDPPGDIAAGIQAILADLKGRWPATKVLLLGIFPRSPKPTDKPRINNDEANKLIAAFADGQQVQYLNINDKLLDADGTLTKEIMPDALHPQQKGYRIWAESIEPKVAELLAAKP